MIPIHATATSDPQRLRWVVPPGNLPSAGTVRQAPGRLGAWLDDGVITELVVGSTDVLITLGAGKTWRAFGDGIREALGEALLDSADWQIDPPVDTADRLAATVTELLTGEIGALAQSHGGSIELVSISGHDVTVRMSGACHGCPASASTLHDKLEGELRRRVGEQVTVLTEHGSATRSLGKKLLTLLVR